MSIPASSSSSPVVVVTGASSGIGRASALRFARQGADLVLAARGATALRAVVAECEGLGARAIAVPTDVTDADAVDALADRAVEEFGRIDVWVNDAAVSVFGALEKVPIEDFRRVLDVNILGYVYGLRAALRVMKRSGKGVVINVASAVAPIPQPYTAAYSMSKAAVRALGVSARSELLLDGETGVKVCTVLPAAIDTPFFANAANYTGRKVRALPPVHTPERVARAIVNLARFPRREVAVGTVGRVMALQHKFTPGTVERLMALQVDSAHLSLSEPAPDTTGNLFAPSAPDSDGDVHGGWDGARKTARRRAIGVVTAMLVGGGVLARRLMR